MTIAIITEAGVRKVAPLVVVAQQAAAIAQQAAGIATAVASERYFASYAAGNSATTAGQYFAVIGSGTYDFHLHGTATPVVQMPVLDGSGNLQIAGDIVLGQGVDRILRIGSESNYYYDLRTRLDDFRIVAADGTIVLNVLYPSYSLNPGVDNVASLGAAVARWSGIYLGSSPNVTSDEREKTWRGAPTETELRAAKRIIAELGFYQWNHEVAVIGADLAKYVFGVRAQAVRDILIDEGLNPAAYKFLSHDEWIDEDTGEAKDRYGVQLESLALFLIAAQETRLAALEERIATLATP